MDINTKEFAFIDECGNTSVNTDKEGSSTHFILAAVLVNGKELNKCIEHLEIIRKQYFQTGEMKSSSVGDNDQRRVKILEDLAELDFKYYAFIVDKRAIFKDSGLIYKQPFLKYLHGVVYMKLFRALPTLNVIADEYGSKDFMDGFKKYVYEKYTPDLFMNPSFEFSNYKNHPLLQISDFLAGSLARVFDQKMITESADNIMATLQKKMIILEEWPPSIKTYRMEPHAGQEDIFDQLISRQVMVGVLEFIDKKKDSDNEHEIRQVETLKYFIYYKNYINPNSYVSTGEILSVLNDYSIETIEEHYFRAQIIAKLRDQGILIASSPKGYKLPTSMADVLTFVEQSHGVIGPMVSRLVKAREQIILATKGKKDILSDPNYMYIRYLIDQNNKDLSFPNIPIGEETITEKDL